MANNTIKSWFHYYSTKEAFDLHLSNNLINSNSICFIEETSQLYTQGQFFGIARSDFASALRLINEHEKSLKNMLGIEGESVNSDAIDNFKEVIEFLKGNSKDSTLTQVLEELKSSIMSYVDPQFLDHQEEMNDISNKLEELKELLSSISNSNTPEGMLLKMQELRNEVYSAIEGMHVTMNNFYDDQNNIIKNAILPTVKRVIKLEEDVSRLESSLATETAACKIYTDKKFKELMDLILKYHP